MVGSRNSHATEAIYGLYLKWFDEETESQLRSCESVELRGLILDRSPLSEPAFQAWWRENSPAARRAHLADWKRGYAAALGLSTERIRKWSGERPNKRP